MESSLQGNQSVPAASHSGKVKKAKAPFGRWFRVSTVALLFSITVLVVAIAGLLYIGNDSEVKYVDTNKLQAVFLNTGQVYYGRIQRLNGQYLVLQHVYYQQPIVTTSGSAKTQTATQTVAKLGCDIKGSDDQLVLNKQQVSFWENLQTNDRVTQAVANNENSSKSLTCTDQSSAPNSPESATSSKQ